MNRALPLLTVASIAALCSPALAQEDITVTGRALPAPLSDAAYSIVTISEERLSDTASGRIEDALKDVAGLQQFRRTDARSANATSQGATLRGLGGNASSRALLVLDGVPQSDPFGGWVTWPAFATERLGGARVTRGGGSGVYGSGALSGLIELDSVTFTKGLTGALAGGSRSSVEASLLAGTSLGGGTGFLAANYARGDGFIPIVSAQRGSADIAAPYEQASLAARGVVPLSVSTELQVNLLGFTDRRTRGTILSGNGGDGADASVRIVHDADEDGWDWEALAYVQMRKFQSRFVAVNAARDTVTQTVDQFNVPSTGIGSRIEVRPPLGEGLELRLGGDWRRTTGETNELFTYVAGNPTRIREAGGQSETLGGFAELSSEMGAVTLTGSGRVDQWWIRKGRLIERTIATGALFRNEIAPDRSGTEWTGRAGASVKLSSELKVRGAGYIGWRLPTLNELYRPFRVGADATAANAALKPERMKGVELGLHWQHVFDGAKPDDDSLSQVLPHTLFDASVTLFDNRLDDAIANVTLASGPGVFPGVGFVSAGGAYRQRLNVDAIRSRGVEIDLGLRRNEGANQPWVARVSYAYSDAKVQSSGASAALNGLRPAQVPKHSASATLGWNYVSATARYVSAQFEDDGNRRSLRDALTFDAVATLPLGKALELSLRGENLTNVRVDAAISGAGVVERATPRTLWIGLRLKP